MIFLSSCNSNKIKDQSQELKTDSVFVKIDSAAKEEKSPIPEIKIDYTGTYKLKVDRYRDYFQHHTLVLEQVNDSITGTYSFKLVGPGKETLADLKGLVNGKMGQSIDDVNSGSELYITLTDRIYDSLKIFSNPSAEYAIRQFLYSPQLGTRFSLEKNTIENNYAGGEWDTWQRIK